MSLILTRYGFVQRCPRVGESSDPSDRCQARLDRPLFLRCGVAYCCWISPLPALRFHMALNAFTNSFDRLARTDIDFPVVRAEKAA